MDKREKKKINNTNYNEFQNKINKYNNSINILYSDTDIFNQYNVNINTNIDILKTQFNKTIINKPFNLKYDIFKNEPIKTIKYLLLPNDEQKKILHSWFY